MLSGGWAVCGSAFRANETLLLDSSFLIDLLNDAANDDVEPRERPSSRVACCLRREPMGSL